MERKVLEQHLSGKALRWSVRLLERHLPGKASRWSKGLKRHLPGKARHLGGAEGTEATPTLQGIEVEQRAGATPTWYGSNAKKSRLQCQRTGGAKGYWSYTKSLGHWSNVKSKLQCQRTSEAEATGAKSRILEQR